MLSINIDKTKGIIFYPTSKKPFMSTKFPELSINSITLERETVTKFLDVIIDQNVTWKAHINKFPQIFLKALLYVIEQR